MLFSYLLSRGFVIKFQQPTNCGWHWASIGSSFGFFHFACVVRKIGYILNMPSNTHYHQMEHIISQTHLMEQYLALLRGLIYS